MNKEDKDLFREAMVLDGFPDTERGITTWMKQVCRIRARALIEGTTEASVLDAIKLTHRGIDNLNDQVQEALQILRDMNEDPNVRIERG